ncbi:rho guanine nucleotide exchange factor 11-like [Petromyzon marinus]|uniref:rho guanine nucleotide exchange factor 11-like n=1 Tax=Petromyzon marinus TaxID=7757 RepID=UPI003F70FB04
MDDTEMDLTFGGCSTGPQKIMGPEDDEFLSDEEQSDDHGPFSDLDQLRSRPAHMAVFLQYVLSQLEPAALLFHLCVEAAQHSKDPKKLMSEIYFTFLERNAPLKIPVADELILAVEECRVRPGLVLDEAVRRAVETAQPGALETARGQLDDYRRRRVMGLGTMFGETMLPPVPNAVKEVHLAEHSLTKISNMIEGTDEERREMIMAAVAVYMRGAGVSVPSALAPALADGSDKRKRSVFNMKKTLGPKKEKEEKKGGGGRPSLFRDYILRPAQRGGGDGQGSSVASMVRQFEPVPGGGAGGFEGGGLELGSTGDLGETRGGGRESGGLRVGRSESLRAIDGGRRSPGSSSRSKSDIDREAAMEATARMGPPPTPTPRTPGDVTPPRTPRSWRRPDDAASVSSSQSSSTSSSWSGVPPAFGDEVALGPDEDLEVEAEAPHWQLQLKPEQLARLGKQEVKRQDVINELLHTERAHVRMLKVLKALFCDRLLQNGVASEAEVRQIFPNLDALLPLHESLNVAMKKLKENEPLVDGVGDALLARFAGVAGEALQAEAAVFCSQQSLALDIIKQRQRKDARFQQFIQDAESNPHCRRLQLKDFLPCEMQRLTKYPLLLDKIAKYTADSSPEHGKVQQASECCKRILLSVNTAVREAENAQRLQDYQRRMDVSPFLEKTQYPYIAEFKNLDLTKRKMLHEGPLTWRLNKEKTLDLHVLLLEDLVVLLQRQEEKLVLRCHSQQLGGASDTRQIYSPIVKLGTVLLREVARDKHAFFMISTSQLGPQIYELVAVSVSERRAWWQRLSDAVAATRKKSTVLLGIAHKEGDGPTSPCPPDAHKEGPAAVGGDSEEVATVGGVGGDSEEVAAVGGVGGDVEEDEEAAPPHADERAGGLSPHADDAPPGSSPGPLSPDSAASPSPPPRRWAPVVDGAGEEGLAGPAVEAVLRLREMLGRLLATSPAAEEGDAVELRIDEDEGSAHDEGRPRATALPSDVFREVELIQRNLQHLQKLEAEFRVLKSRASASPKGSLTHTETGQDE